MKPLLKGAIESCIKRWFTPVRLKAQRQMWQILQGASSWGVKFTRKVLAWYDKQFPS